MYAYLYTYLLGVLPLGVKLQNFARYLIPEFTPPSWSLSFFTLSISYTHISGSSLRLRETANDMFAVELLI